MVAFTAFLTEIIIMMDQSFIAAGRGQPTEIAFYMIISSISIQLCMVKNCKNISDLILFSDFGLGDCTCGGYL